MVLVIKVNVIKVNVMVLVIKVNWCSALDVLSLWTQKFVRVGSQEKCNRSLMRR